MRNRLEPWVTRHWEVLLPIGVWSIPPLLFLVRHIGEMHGMMLARLIHNALNCALYAGFAPIVFSAIRRYRARDLAPHLARIVLLAVLNGLVLKGEQWVAPAAFAAVEGPWPSNRLNVVGAFLATATLLYIATALVGYAIIFAQRSREQEARLAEMRLAMLRAQLNPHFLFNSLNAVAGLVRAHDTTGAVRVLARISDALRHVLATSDIHEVPLRDELAFVDDYLEIERVRFPDRVSVEWCVSGDVVDAKVPSLVLQPLVENALRHGAGRLVVAARRIGPSLRLEVQDDGPGLASPALNPGAAGVGLANTRARLIELYGAEGDLSLSNATSGGVVATVTLPYHT